MKTYLIPTLLCLLLVSCHEPVTPEPEPQDTTTYRMADTTVVYECNERLFARSDAFRAIGNYLPRLEELQVNVLWLMPVHPRGTVKAVGSPYCVKDYLAVDPAFGTMEDLRDLIDNAHMRGMRVMLDWVANHTAWDHPWYQTHPEWYTTPEGDERNWNDVVPLDYSQQVVCDTMQAVMLWWVREMDVDGFRCDYAHGVPTTFWQPAIEALRTVKPDLVMLAETSKYDYYKAGFDWLYSWNYLSAVQTLFKNGTDVANLLKTSRKEYDSTPTGKERLRYITTHDASSENAPSTFYKSARAELAASCLTFFLAGVPMIYSSQEIGYLSRIDFFSYKLLDFAQQTETTAAWQQLMQAYRATAVERYGEMKDYSTESVALFTRTQGKKALLVAVNCSGTAQQVATPVLFQGQEAKDMLTGSTVTTGATLDLPAYGYTVLTK